MASRKLTSAIKAIERLSYQDLKRANQCVQQHLSEDEMGQIVAERKDCVDSCPYRRYEHFMKWGSSGQGKQ